MRFVKNRILWISVYALAVTCVFLYVLFPSEFVLRWIESQANAAGLTLTADSLDPSLPLGVKLQNVAVRAAGAASGPALVRGDLLDVQINPLHLFQNVRTVRFQGSACGGSFEGSAGIPAEASSAGLSEGNAAFQSIDLARLGANGLPFFRGMSGQAKGTVFYVQQDAATGGAVGKLSVYLSRGAYALPEPFLGVPRIDFDRGEIQAQLKDAAVLLTKFEIYGAQVNCFLTGSIRLADRVEESLLNLKGSMELAGGRKIKMNVTVGGTLARPSFRYL